MELIEKILKANTLEELKEVGKMLEIKYTVQEVAGDRIKIRSRSWQELFQVILTLKEFPQFKSSNNENMIINIAKEQNDSNVQYFKTRTDEIIFALLELKGKQRQEKLKITNFCYNNPQYAKKWRNDLVKIIHPDKTEHPKSAEAMQVLKELYEGMIEQ